MTIEISRLDNGLTVITDDIAGFESASIGIFVNVGSVDENSNQIGISHFLEHMAFKGTETRSALQISEEIESVGGFMNAYTSKEMTAYHTKVLKSDVNLSIDIVSDILQNSTFDELEFEREKGVIIQEIRQLNDTPDDLVFDMFQEKAFYGEKLGSQILGSESDVMRYVPNDLRTYLKTKYSTSHMVLAASGGVSHDEIVQLACKFTHRMKDFDIEPVEPQSYIGGFIFKKKPLEQTHVVLGFEGLSHTHKNKYDLGVLSTILGGGMSSRLFQEVREKRGLAYSIFSFTSNYRDTGTFGIYAACEHDKTQEVLEISKAQCIGIIENLTEEELQKAKTQIKASLLMGLESSSTRMERLASQFLFHGKVSTPQEVASKIEEISIESVQDIARKIFTSKPTLAVIGPESNIENLYDKIS